MPPSSSSSLSLPRPPPPRTVNHSPWLASLDLYRKVPVDLLEGSQEGKAVSWIALLVLLTLFVLETKQFLTPQHVTDIFLDTSWSTRPNRNPQPQAQAQAQPHDAVQYVRVDFNITLLDLSCSFATVNVVSFLGTQLNITSHIQRMPLQDGLDPTATTTTTNTPPALLHRFGFATRQTAQQQQQESVLLHDPSVTATLDELHANGKDSVSFNPETLEYALEEYEFVFVKYFANWCSHCRALAPTWERLAEVLHDTEPHTPLATVLEATATNSTNSTTNATTLITTTSDPAEEDPAQLEQQAEHLQHQDYSDEELRQAKLLDLPVLIGEVDCVEHQDLCWDEEIRGYPTMVLYVNGERFKGGVYYGDRTVSKLIQFLLWAEEMTEHDEPDKMQQHAQAALAKHTNMTTAHAEWLQSMNHSRAFHNARLEWNPSDHPACQLVGSLYMNRAPGHFFIQATSPHHDVDPHSANLSHVIHHLSFHPISAAEAAAAEDPNHVPQPLVSSEPPSIPDFVPSHYVKAVAPLDGHAFVVPEIHQSWHHYLKLVSTNADRYHVMPSSQVSLYRDDHVPEAKFVLDISPIAIQWRTQHQPWYSYITSLMAILGGTFTVVGMLEYVVSSASRQIRQSTTRRPRPRPPSATAVPARSNPKLSYATPASMGQGNGPRPRPPH